MATPRDTASLGIDIGGTRIRVGMVADDGRILAREETLIPPEGDPAPLRDSVRDLVGRVTDTSGQSPSAVGVAMPGVWDQQTGIMQKAVNLPRIEGTCLPEFFTEATGQEVRLEADVNAAAWGQYRVLDPRPERLLYLSIGTGIGGAVILDGRIMRHTRGGAGHFGFLIVDTTPGAPGGRNKVPGCLSALAAGPALHLANTGEPDNEAIGNEPFAYVVVDRAARGLAVATMNLVHVFAPDRMLLGGGVVDHHPELVDHARRAFAQYSSVLIPEGFEIARAPLTTHEAGVIGAALMARHGETPT